MSGKYCWSDNEEYFYSCNEADTAEDAAAAAFEDDDDREMCYVCRVKKPTEEEVVAALFGKDPSGWVEDKLADWSYEITGGEPADGWPFFSPGERESISQRLVDAVMDILREVECWPPRWFVAEDAREFHRPKGWPLAMERPSGEGGEDGSK